MEPFRIPKSELLRLFALSANEAIVETAHLPVNDVRVRQSAAFLLAARVLTGIEVPSPRFEEFPLPEEMELTLRGMELAQAIREGRSIEVTED